MVKDIAIGGIGLGFDFRAGQIGTVLPTAATLSMFFRSCVAQALSRGDGSRHSLHDSPQHCEYVDF